MLVTKNLNIVLVRAENPMNMGQVARAMKNFSVSKLILVKSVPHQVEAAYTTGRKAKEILNQAKCHETLKSALEKSSLSIGFTARVRVYRGGPANFREFIPQIIEQVGDGEIHLIFGNEKNGLSNDELKTCHAIATIPTSPSYESLNLSHAVAITLSHIFEYSIESKNYLKKKEKYYVSDEEFESLMDHFKKVLKDLDYHEKPKIGLLHQVSRQIREFYSKRSLEQREARLFRAFLYRIQEKLKH